jgi:hypothetical protein
MSMSRAEQGPYSPHLIFFVTYKLAQQARVFVVGRTFSKVSCNTLAYWAYILDTNKMNCCGYDPGDRIHNTSFSL